MAKNGNKEGIIELWGHEFSLAKNGLDEDQVVSFVNALIGERDQLGQRLEHMSSLTKLAEKTICEADRLAEEIRKEATGQAKTEADAILAEAEERAQKTFEEKRAEILDAAYREAETIKENAEREAGLLLEREMKRIQPEIKDIARRLHEELAAQLESLKQQAASLQAEFEQRLFQSTEEASAVTVEEEPASAQDEANFEESEATGPQISLEHPEEPAIESEQATPTLEAGDMAEAEEKAPSADGQERAVFENEIELEVLPPMNIKQIMGIMKHLDGLAEVENTDLIPLADRPLIIVSLREPMPLIDALISLPEVDEAREVTAEGDRKRIQITLSGNSVLDEAKERLNKEVYHSLSS